MATNSSVPPGAPTIAFESFGVRIGVSADDTEVGTQVAELIPPHSEQWASDAVDHHFSVISDEGATVTVRYDVRDGVPADDFETASWVAYRHDLPFALALLEDHLHSCIALYAPDRIFIQAGAVGYMDRMIVTPGPAISGKSTLVAALVRAGATYYSDRFAVLDKGARVHPYLTSNQDGVAGEEPLPVGAIVLTSYRPGAEWQPRPLSPGQGALALMERTEPAHDRQEESMRFIRRVFDADPFVIESDRDEADLLASRLLTDLEKQFSASS